MRNCTVAGQLQPKLSHLRVVEMFAVCFDLFLFEGLFIRCYVHYNLTLIPHIFVSLSSSFWIHDATLEVCLYRAAGETWINEKGK